MHVHEDYMPTWTGEVCRVWSEFLDRLSEPRSTESALDLRLKLALYADQATKWGILRERLTCWNEIVNRLNAALEAANCGTVATSLDFVALQQLLDARRRFFEIDTRFGQLGPKGVFHLLGAAGYSNIG